MLLINNNYLKETYMSRLWPVIAAE